MSKAFPFFSQSHYVEIILDRFGMKMCKPVSTPACTPGNPSVGEVEPVDRRVYQEMVGALLFLSTRTRPDISVAVNLLCRQVSAPTKKDMIVCKRVFRYLQGTRGLSLLLARDSSSLVCYSDADWAGDQTCRNSTSGGMTQYGRSTVYWRSSRQTCVALSTTESEFIAASEACKTVIWLQELLKEFDVTLHGPTKFYEDNQGTISWGTDGFRNAKHVSVRAKFVKDMVEKGNITLVYCPSAEMLPDVSPNLWEGVDLKLCGMAWDLLHYLSTLRTRGGLGTVCPNVNTIGRGLCVVLCAGSVPRCEMDLDTEAMCISCLQALIGRGTMLRSMT